MRKSLLSVSALFVAAMPAAAFAHHVMDGALPATPLQGLLSGLGHPVIGLDHLAALVAVGCVASLLPAGALLALGFVIAGLAGVALHLGAFTLPAVEPLVAISVLALGLFAALALRRVVPAAILFGLAGFVHGYALAESIIGAEPAPLYAYLAGLAIIQFALAVALTLGFRAIGVRLQSPFAARLSGGLAAVFGLAVLVQQIAA